MMSLLIVLPYLFNYLRMYGVIVESESKSVFGLNVFGVCTLITPRLYMAGILNADVHTHVRYICRCCERGVSPIFSSRAMNGLV